MAREACPTFRTELCVAYDTRCKPEAIQVGVRTLPRIDPSKLRYWEANIPQLDELLKCADTHIDVQAETENEADKNTQSYKDAQAASVALWNKLLDSMYVACLKDMVFSGGPLERDSGAYTDRVETYLEICPLGQPCSIFFQQRDGDGELTDMYMTSGDGDGTVTKGGGTLTLTDWPQLNDTSARDTVVANFQLSGKELATQLSTIWLTTNTLHC